MDPSFLLLPRLRSLCIARNGLCRLQYLQKASLLTSIDASFNRIASIDQIGLVVGQLARLNLRGNKIAQFAPLAGLKALEELDCADNLVRADEELQALAKLPFLRVLSVSGNPVCGPHAEQRQKVLSLLFQNPIECLLCQTGTLILDGLEVDPEEIADYLKGTRQGIVQLSPQKQAALRRYFGPSYFSSNQNQLMDEMKLRKDIYVQLGGDSQGF